MKQYNGNSAMLGLILLLVCQGVSAAAPTFTTGPEISGVRMVGNLITIKVDAADPQGLPLTMNYDYGNGSSDTLGKHIYTAAGTYPITVTASNGTSSARESRLVIIKEIPNLWIARQWIIADSTGTKTWQAKYIYNADRTQANIFNPATENFVTTLGHIPAIQVPSNLNNGRRFAGVKPRFVFKSDLATVPLVSVVLNESTQTITINAKSETTPDTFPSVLTNKVQLGANNYSVEEAFDSNGIFTPNAGYRSLAFVVAGAAIRVGQPGKDSAMLSMYLGDPAFLFPGATSSRTVRVRMTNVLNQVVFEKDLTNSVTLNAGILRAPGGAFSYDSLKGHMVFRLSKTTLAGALVTSEEHVRVDVTLGDQIYTTRVTLFSQGCGKHIAYGTLIPKKFCNFTPGRIADTTSPKVLSTVPVDAAMNVPTNIKLGATFSEAMDASTFTASTFLLMQGNLTVTGVVTYTAGSNTANFVPDAALVPNTAYTATITSGAKDLAGNALAGDYIWNFSTGAGADAIAPMVLSTNPADQATNVSINHTINATFDEAMDPATIIATNFTLAGPGLNPVSGTVSYDSINRIAIFTPNSDLAPGVKYTATVTTGVKDLAGNALAANQVWTFTTGSLRGVQPVALGGAASFGTFGGGAGMTNEGIFTVVNGDISTTGASTTVTGFHDSVGDIYSETPLNKGQVNGRIYTAPPTPGGTGVGGNASTFAIATQGAKDAQKAYDDLLPASIPGGIDPGAGQLGGLTLAPGVYKAAGATFQITGSDLTLDAQGDTNAVWVFQMAASLTVGAPGAPRSVNMINGAQAKNVFWQVGSSATINAAGGGTMVGTILASSGITFSTAGNVTLVTLNGRAIGLHAATTLVNTVINVPAP